jgi:hypothetical protein
MKGGTYVFAIELLYRGVRRRCRSYTHRAPTPLFPSPPPPPVRVAKTGKNHMNEEIIPLLPTGIGERFSQTISN